MERIETGEFREDLFYRLNVIPIHIPPLCERPEDIPALVDAFVKKHSDGRRSHLLGRCGGNSSPGIGRATRENSRT